MKKAMAEVSNHYIAYFDVLGYKAFFEDEQDDGDLINSIIELVGEVNGAIKEDDSLGSLGFKVVSFSDNFAIAVDPSGEGVAEDFALGVLVVLVAYIQLHCLERYKLLIRGGICYGNLYMANDIVFGAALIQATEIEKNAFYPRVIIDNAAVERLEKICEIDLDEMLIRKDFDGLYYIAAFSLFNRLINESYIVETVKNLSGISIESHISNLRTVIAGLIKKYCRYVHNIRDSQKILRRENIIRKHVWLVWHFNAFCKSAGLENEAVLCEFVLNERVMRVELRVSPRVLNRGYVHGLHSLY